jgi:diguanylate cyclase (GGDEF)-like protein/hemerythrin-like metal-binding protein
VTLKPRADADPFGTLLSESTLVSCCALDETRQLVLAASRGLRALFDLPADGPPFPFLSLVVGADRSIAADALARQRDGARVHAQRSGGSSFLAELRFEGALVAVEDVSLRDAAEERLRLLAMHDPLTGLPNRTLLHDRMQQALLESKRNHTLLAVMVLDLDRFKVVNDEYGHRVGDEVLKLAAQRFVHTAREVDTLARIGGDEFVITAHLARREDAAVLAGRLVQSLGEPIEVEEKLHALGVSVGIAVSPDDGDSVDELFHRADQAMYEAKNAGTHVAFAERSRGEVLPLSAVVWDESIRLGVPLMDRQHREIVDALNRVVSAVSGRAGTGVIVSRVDDLIASTRLHFDTEEQLMRAARVGSLEAHAAEHRSLLGDLTVLRNSTDFGDDVALVLQHLDRWLVDHIDGFDRAAARELLAAEGQPAFQLPS